MSAEMEAPGEVRRRRKKLEPDPAVHESILATGLDIVRDQGLTALNLTEVLARTSLSTRAFYRHFESMDDLVRAVFEQLARAEAGRLRSRMAGAANPVEAVARWIDGRLDLAFDETRTSGLRNLSLQAQSQMFASPDKVGAAFAEMLKPLVEQLESGTDAGLFRDIDPGAEAESIHGVVWVCTQRHWLAPHRWSADVRRRTIQFCLRGLGVDVDTIASLLGEKPSAQRQRHST